MKTYVVGEVVKLKSGGPLMTIIEAADGKVTAQWVDSRGRTKRTTLPSECFQRINLPK